MAEPYDTLLQVQDHDTALDQLRHRLEAMPERAALPAVRERQCAPWRPRSPRCRPGSTSSPARQAELEERIAASATRRHTSRSACARGR